MASNPKSQYADWKELHGAQKEALQEFAAGVADVLRGTAKEYAAPFVNTASTLLDGEAESHRTSTTAFPNYNGPYPDIDWQSLKNTQSDALQSVVRQTQGTADALAKSGAENIERAKQGLGTFGQGVVDLGVQSLKMLGDAGLGSITGVGAIPYLAIRSFGDAAQTARQEGASVGQQTLYGAANAISTAVIEKAFDGLSGLYGKGEAKKWADKFASLLKNKNLQKYAEAAFNDAGEGVAESFLTDVADQLLKTTYNGKSAAENIVETEWDRVKRDIIINTIVGILFGDKVLKVD